MSFGGIGKSKRQYSYSQPKQPVSIKPSTGIIECVEYHPNFISRPMQLYTKSIHEFNFEERYVLNDNGEKNYKLNRSTCIFGDEDINDAPPKIWGADNPIQCWTQELLIIKN
jgi:hypothetical protein